jgi:hypothetical protein
MHQRLLLPIPRTPLFRVTPESHQSTRCLHPRTTRKAKARAAERPPHLSRQEPNVKISQAARCFWPVESGRVDYLMLKRLLCCWRILRWGLMRKLFGEVRHRGGTTRKDWTSNDDLLRRNGSLILKCSWIGRRCWRSGVKGEHARCFRIHSCVDTCVNKTYAEAVKLILAFYLLPNSTYL